MVNQPRRDAINRVSTGLIVSNCVSMGLDAINRVSTGRAHAPYAVRVISIETVPVKSGIGGLTLISRT